MATSPRPPASDYPDPTAPFYVVRNELAQRRQTGHDVTAIAERLAGKGPEDVEDLLELHAALVELEPDPDWPYSEPSDLSGILAAIPPDPGRFDVDELPFDRMLGAWQGRISGCMLGKPIEHSDWTSDRIRSYLELAGAFPLDDYIPVLDPMPEGYRFRECWPETTRGRIDGSARDDDVDYSILCLHLLEHHGLDLQTSQVADALLTLVPYRQVYTSERIVYRNLVAGVPVEDAGRRGNPYREWIGAQIRADLFGWVSPGAPRAAATLAFQDASLSHVGNGIYGAMWIAALGALVAGGMSIRDSVPASVDHVPTGSRLFEALSFVLDLAASGASWEEALAGIQARFGHYHIVHTVNNAALVAAGLLWGEGDFVRTTGLTVSGGWDTDSNGATVGGITGLAVGASSLPPRFVEPLADRVRSAVVGYDGSSISDLARRTLRLAETHSGSGASRAADDVRQDG